MRPPLGDRRWGADRPGPRWFCWMEQKVLERAEQAEGAEEERRKVPAGAQAAAQAPQLGQAAVPHLQVADPRLQVVGELGQVLHRPDVLHEDLLLREEHQRQDQSTATFDPRKAPEQRLLCPP